MAEASEAEYGALYENTKIGVPLRTTLEEMNLSQGITKTTIENYIECGIINTRIQQNDHAPWTCYFIG